MSYVFGETLPFSSKVAPGNIDPCVAFSNQKLFRPQKFQIHRDATNPEKWTGMVNATTAIQLASNGWAFF